MSKKKKSKFGNSLRFVWIIVGILTAAMLIQVLLLLLTVKEYFP